MARTKFTGPPESSTKDSPTTEAASHPTAAPSRAPAPASAAKPKAPGKTRISKRARGTAESLQKDVIVLYEALTYGVGVKVSTNS